MSGGVSGSSGSSTPQLTPQQLVQLYQSSLPGLLGTTVAQAPSVTSTLAQSAAGANPIYTQSGLNQLNTLAPGYQQAGANLANSQAQSQADLLNGAGANAASAASGLLNKYNPLLSTDANQAANLVNSINLNGLSVGEQAAVERSLNQSNTATGNLGLDNATNAVSNAMNFGNALQAKRTALGTALGVGNNTAATNLSAFNPITTATNAGNTANNFGLGTFNPTQANSTTNTATNFGSSFGNQLTGIGSSAKQNNNSSAIQGGVCFLTTACCEYMGLPDDCEELTVLRKFRDEYVPKELVEEYYRIGPKIVEKVKDSPSDLYFIYEVVKECIADIAHKQYELALSNYKSMVHFLKGKYGVL